MCVALEMPDAEGVGVQLIDKVQGSPGNLTPQGGKAWWGESPLLSFGEQGCTSWLRIFRTCLGEVTAKSHCSFTNSSWVTLPADLASDISSFTYPREQVCREEHPCPQ